METPARSVSGSGLVIWGDLFLGYDRLQGEQAARCSQGRPILNLQQTSAEHELFLLLKVGYRRASNYLPAVTAVAPVWCFSRSAGRSVAWRVMN